MRILSTAAIAALAASAASQDFLHYKFDANCTSEVINYATGPQALAGNGVLETNSPVQFDTGVFGGCLAGGANVAPISFNRVLTGWDPGTQNVTGSLTIAWFMRQRSSPAATIAYLSGIVNTSGFRLFTNGIGGAGLYQRVILAGGGNGTNSTIANDFFLPSTTANIQALAAAGWVHVAIVVDATAQTADWYVNGTSVLQLTGVPGALINTPGAFRVGGVQQTTNAGQPYDLDEYLISLRAYSPAEVLALSLSPRAGDGDYTSVIPSQCGAGNVTLGSAGGPPFAGNLGYTLAVNTATPSLFILLAGFDRCMFGSAIPLPFDGTPISPLLAGCWILADAPVTLGGTSIGSASVPLGIPATIPPATAIYTQVLALDLVTLASSMSSGFATSVGF